MIPVSAGRILGSPAGPSNADSCDSVSHGYHCQPEISRYWGTYTSYFSVPSRISASLPQDCSITFVNTLNRHGARWPTARAHDGLRQAVEKLTKASKMTNQQRGKYAFLANYRFEKEFPYELTESLTAFGQQQCINAGIQFFELYKDLAVEYLPFVRSSGYPRADMSAHNWTQGFLQAKTGVPTSYPIESLPSNPRNTLYQTTAKSPTKQKAKEADPFLQSRLVTDIVQRIETEVQVDLTANDVIFLMEMCPMSTVASPNGEPSKDWCPLFTPEEYRVYDYYQTLSKYFGFGLGSKEGADQGIGFARELIARMTDHLPRGSATDVHDLSNLDNETFPLGRKLYADFSHDNIMLRMFTVLGFFGNTKPPSFTSITPAHEMNGFYASRVIPFAGRARFEKMQCEGESEELIRVVLNDRVVRLDMCGDDALGRCKLSKFLESLTSAIERYSE